MNKEKDESFAARLTWVVDNSGLSRSAFAKAIGVGETTLQNYMSGDTEPAVSKLLKVCEVSGVYLQWLVMNIGPRNAHEERTTIKTLNPEVVGYSKEHIYAVLIAFNQALDESGRELTAESRANLAVSFLGFFDLSKNLQSDIKALLDATLQAKEKKQEGGR